MYQRRPSRSTPRLAPGPLLLLGLLLAVLGALVFVGAKMLLAPRPAISLAGPFDVVGRNVPLVVQVKDPAGLRTLRVAVAQGGDVKVIAEQTFEGHQEEATVRWVPAAEKRFRLREGPGKVIVDARNASWGDFFRGKTGRLEHDFTARLVPPRIEVLTSQHYVNQGGADMVVYRVTPAAAESGVQVGDAYFRGHALPGARDESVRFAIFAYPYDAPAGTAPRLEARDEAGNEAVASFNVKVFPKRFRTRTLALDDAFLARVGPEILGHTPSLQDQGDPLQNYLLINRDLRKQNNRGLADIASRSEPRFLWNGPFRQLGSSQVEASFADHRIYTYQGREVDRQDHLGYDLATTSNAPVSAANDGVVLYADYYGIYGNTIVVDHGYGLLSVYGHLSRFDVKPGHTVTGGQVIGATGATGLAGGDHLHFSIVLQGEQVDAREWWDGHWLEDRILSKLRRFGAPAGGDPAPASPSPS